jgi:CAAX protease family protein
MKQKLKTIRIVLLSLIGMFLLFIGIIGIGNCFQVNQLKTIGNIFMILFPILTYLGVRLFNRRINKLNINQYGFHFKHFFKYFFIGVSFALAMTTIILLISSMFFGIKIRFMGLKSEFEAPLLDLLLTYTIVGVWEEFYFRGLVFNTFLKNRFGFQFSAIVSSILFSIVHWSSNTMTEASWTWYIGILSIGYILVFLYVSTNSIWSVAFFHFMWNFLASFMNGNENKIGIFEIANYHENSKIIGNISVVFLCVTVLALFIISKLRNSEEIKKYITQVTTANNFCAAKAS